MFCIRCGKEIPEFAINCPYCGSAQIEDAETGALPVSAPAAANSSAVRLTKRSWAKALLIAALLCFFLPFIAVSCTNEDTGRTYYSRGVSGFEMMNLDNGGLNLKDEDREAEESFGKKVLKRLPSILAIAAFCMGVIAGLLLFLGKSARAAGRLSVGSAICLLLLALLFFLLYSPLSPVTDWYSEETQKVLRYIKVSLRPGIFLSAGCFIADAVFCFKDKPPEQYY